MALTAKTVSMKEHALVVALHRAGASSKAAVLKRGELATHPPTIYQSLRSKGILSTKTEGHGRAAKTTVRLLVEPSELKTSTRGAAPPIRRSAGADKKPTVEEMAALCELLLREERLAQAAAAPDPRLLQELDSIKAAFTAAIAANDVARMVELGKSVADVQKKLESSASAFDPRAKAFERVERNPEHATLAPYLRYLSVKRS